MNNLIKELLARKDALGLTQDEVADMAGVSQTLISMIERGHENVTLGTYSKIAQALSDEEARREKANGKAKAKR